MTAKTTTPNKTANVRQAKADWETVWDDGLANLHEQIDQLSDRSKATVGDTKVWADTLVEQLRKQAETAEKRVRKATAAGEAQWEADRDAADAAYKDVAAGVEQALSRFKT